MRIAVPIAMAVVCVLVASAPGAITYLQATRAVTATAGTSDSVQSTDLLPFDFTVQASDVFTDTAATARQSSNLEPLRITFGGNGTSRRGFSGSAGTALWTLDTTFVLDGTTPVSISGNWLQNPLGWPFALSGFVQLSRGSEMLFDSSLPFVSQNPPTVPITYSALLPPGTYRLNARGQVFGAGSFGQSSTASMGFTLTVPAPATGFPALIILAAGLPRRPRRSSKQLTGA